jgi:hypothetical protein
MNKNILLLKLNILFYLKCFILGKFWGDWNGLIQFTLFQIGEIYLGSRAFSLNGLCSKFEVPLYFVSLILALWINFSWIHILPQYVEGAD